MKTLAYLRRHLREELKVAVMEEPFRYLGFHRAPRVSTYWGT